MSEAIGMYLDALDRVLVRPWDTLFERRPEISQALSPERRGLTPRRFDGLLWRTRVTENGLEKLGRLVDLALEIVDLALACSR